MLTSTVRYTNMHFHLDTFSRWHIVNWMFHRVTVTIRTTVFLQTIQFFAFRCQYWIHLPELWAQSMTKYLIHLLVCPGTTLNLMILNHPIPVDINDEINDFSQQKHNIQHIFGIFMHASNYNSIIQKCHLNEIIWLNLFKISGVIIKKKTIVHVHLYTH